MASTVLIVDDSESMLDLLEVYLEELGSKVIRTNLPNEAIHLLKTNEVDLIISDMIMPDLDGTKLFEKIRADKAIPFIPFMLMTAFDHRDIEKYCYSFGIDEFILKPIEKDVLQERVRKILSLTKDYRASSKGESLICGKIAKAMDNDFINHIYNVLMVGRTGFFEIVREHGSKEKIWILDGEIQNAKFENLFAHDALKSILELESGEFVFIEGDFGVVERRIKEASMDLILHLCQDIDESKLT